MLDEHETNYLSGNILLNREKKKAVMKFEVPLNIFTCNFSFFFSFSTGNAFTRPDSYIIYFICVNYLLVHSLKFIEHYGKPNNFKYPFHGI